MTGASALSPAERYLGSFPAGRIEEFAVRGLDPPRCPAAQRRPAGLAGAPGWQRARVRRLR